MASAAVSSAPHKHRVRRQEVGLLLVTCLMMVGLSIYGYFDAAPGRDNTFLNRENLVEGVAKPMSVYAIMAVGVTVVIITGGIDISLGAIFGLSAMLSAWFLQRYSVDAPVWQILPIAILLPCLIGLLCGLINGLLVVALRLHPFIVTLGTMSIFRGLANVLPPEKTLPARGQPLPTAFTDGFMRVEMFDVELVPMLVMFVVVALGMLFLRFMTAGLETYAVGGNELASRFSGLRVDRIKLRAYAVAGLCAGIAAMVSLGRFGTASATTGTGYELTVIAAAVVGGASLLGGRGSAIGALLGTLIIALIENSITSLNLQQEYRLIIIGSAIVIAVSIDRFSESLSARRRRT